MRKWIVIVCLLGSVLYATARVISIVRAPVTHGAAAAGWNDPYSAGLRLRLWMDPTATNASGLVNDSSGEGNHMTNMPSFATGPAWTIVGTNENSRVEHAYDFDAGDDNLELTIANFQADEQGSLTAWIKRENDGVTHNVFASCDIASDLYYIWFFVDDSDHIRVRSNEAAADDVEGSTAINAGSWYHLAWVSDALIWTFYVNGQAETSLTTNAGGNVGEWFADISNRDNITVGAFKRTGYGHRCEGFIDDVRIYTNILTATAVSNIWYYTHPTNNTEVRP